ncbi:predicted protein [Streptomyces iranensis]|uniref:Uncharacterized protein n=1 Tax=Streptomyces iranensis TaxID=576784 RepID=A0A061A9V2_9ACTN|nr:predicted protein [Streptomyces iranensis]
MATVSAATVSAATVDQSR